MSYRRAEDTRGWPLLQILRRCADCSEYQEELARHNDWKLLNELYKILGAHKDAHSTKFLKSYSPIHMHQRRNQRPATAQGQALQDEMIDLFV